MLGKSGSGGLPRLRRRSITAAGRGPGSRISNVSHRGCAIQAWSASEHHGRAHVSCLRLAPAAPPTAPTRVTLCRDAVWIKVCGSLGAPDGRSAGALAPRGIVAPARYRQRKGDEITRRTLPLKHFLTGSPTPSRPLCPKPGATDRLFQLRPFCRVPCFNYFLPLDSFFLWLEAHVELQPSALESCASSIDGTVVCPRMGLLASWSSGRTHSLTPILH